MDAGIFCAILAGESPGSIFSVDATNAYEGQLCNTNSLRLFASLDCPLNLTNFLAVRNLRSVLAMPC
jgi:hypothetical protein